MSPLVIYFMLLACIITNILATALPSLRISPLLLIRIATIALLYAAALTFNVVYIQSIGLAVGKASGIGIFSGLFTVTLISQSIQTFIYLVGALISPFDTFLTMDILSGETMLLLSSLVPVKPGDDKPSRRLTNAEKSQFTLSEKLPEILVGLGLEEAYSMIPGPRFARRGTLMHAKAEKQKNSQNARLGFGQGVVNKEYLFHLYELFKAYCASKPIESNMLPHKVTGVNYSCVSFNTLSLGCFNELYDLFYLSGKKVVPRLLKLPFFFPRPALRAPVKISGPPSGAPPETSGGKKKVNLRLTLAVFFFFRSPKEEKNNRRGPKYE